MVQPLNILKESPSQTAGPYVHIGTTPNFLDIKGVYNHDLGRVMCNEKTKGERIAITGHIYDGAGAPLKDALVEIWQPDWQGFFNSPLERRGEPDPHFSGWGRQPVDLQSGEFRFETIKPGQVPFHDGRMQAPHINVWIVARGINLGLNTRIYFSDEEQANQSDPLLQRIEHKARIKTLIGQRQGNEVVFDVHLQGENETVFFDI